MKWLRQHILTAIGAHRDHGGDGCNRDIAVAARWAEMALDDGLSRGGTENSLFPRKGAFTPAFCTCCCFRTKRLILSGPPSKLSLMIVFASFHSDSRSESAEHIGSQSKDGPRVLKAVVLLPIAYTWQAHSWDAKEQS
jgi:hypothetical protein